MASVGVRRGVRALGWLSQTISKTATNYTRAARESMGDTQTVMPSIAGPEAAVTWQTSVGQSSESASNPI
jgi:hypothetical protein